MTALETCLGISGSFEGGNGQPRWDLLSGDGDLQGISVGALQWCVGQGSIKPLIQKTIDRLGGPPDQFAAITHLLYLDVPSGLAYVRSTWLNPNKSMTDEAKALWSSFLLQQECIDSQLELAQAIYDSALREANTFLPWLAPVDDNIRVASFFFDLHVQQGSLSKKQKDGSHLPLPLESEDQADGQRAIDLGTAKGMTKTANAWKAVLDGGDTLANVLLHYAYERSLLGNMTYQWDTVSRRGTIACRHGSVHGKWFDLTETLA